MHPQAKTLFPGQIGTYSGFPAVVQSKYCEGMWNICLPRGYACVSEHDFIPDPNQVIDTLNQERK